MIAALLSRLRLPFIFASWLLLAANVLGAQGSLLGVTLTPFPGGTSWANAVVMQADGKPVLVGQSAVGATQFALTRLNVDGTVDTTYGANHSGTQLQPLAFNDSIPYAAALQADGKVVAAGTALDDSNSIHLAVARFNTDGTLDASFGGANGIVTSIGPGDSGAYAIAIQGDGKSVVGGWSRGATGKSVLTLVRFNADGSRDTTFGSQGVATFPEGASNEAVYWILIAADGSMFVVGGNSNYTRYARVTSAGSIDSTFAGGGATITGFYASTFAQQADGKLVIGGTYNGAFATARVNVDGTMDATYGSGGVATLSTGSFPVCTGVVPLADGHILASGSFYYISSSQVFTARFNADGSYDSSYGEPAVAFGFATRIAARAGGGYILAGSQAVQSGTNTLAVAITGTGSLDTTFNATGTTSLPLGADTASTVASARQSDGKVVVVGNDSSRSNTALTRYNVDGSLDTTFGRSGVATIAITATNAVALQADGKIVVGGTSIARLNADGSIDTTFGSGGNGIVAAPSGMTVYGLAIQGDGSIVGAGGSNGSGYHSSFVRLLPSGAFDTTFGNGGSVILPVSSSGDELDSVAVQPDGKIVAAGWDFISTSTPPFRAMLVVRVNADGTLDNGFGAAGIRAITFQSAYAAAAAVALQADGSIVAGGTASPSSTGPNDFALARLTPAGALDGTFGNGGIVQSRLGDDDRLRALALLADGKIVAAGSIGSLVGLAQYLPNGSLDTSFGSGGAVMQSIAITSRPTGKDFASGIAVATDGTLDVAATAASSIFAFARFAGEGASGTLATATVAASANPSPSNINQVVMLSATVSGSAGTPTGFVDFVIDGGRAIVPCSRVTVSAGSAQCATSSLPDGQHTITAIYSGDATYASASASFSQFVNKLTASVSLTSSANPVYRGTSVTFTATVSGNGGTPTGTLTFSDGAFQISGCTSIAMTTMNAGAATCTTTLNTMGAHSITASYSGDSTYYSASSSPLTVNVQGIPAGDTNWALASNGGVASASSQFGAGFPIAAINDGDGTGTNWSNGGGWADGTNGFFPDWVEIDFNNGPKQIDTVVLYTVQDNWQSPSPPTDTMTFTQYGVTAFTVQGWDGAAWQTLATVTGNNLVKRGVSFTPFNTTKIRVNVTAALNGLSRITELETWGVPGTVSSTPINMALQGNGGVASASSQYGSGYPVSAINDGEVAGAAWTNGGGWADGTANQWPDWVEVDLGAQASLTSVVVYTLQDNWQAPAQPTDTMTFSQYGVTGFVVQGWTGSQWMTLGTVSGNNLVKRTVTFSPFLTSKIRVTVTGALASLSRITELQAWGVPQYYQCTCAVQVQSNVALASKGATVTASSQFSADYPVTAINNNERAGANWSAGGGWADGTANQYPDWVEIDFNGAQTIDHVVVYTVQDNWQNPVEPTDTMIFSQYGITDFTVQSWDGTQWATLATVSGNNLVKRTVSFGAVTTGKIRINVTGALSSLARITEVEAWGYPASVGLPQMNWAAASNGGTATASSQFDANYPASAAIDGNTAGTNWSAGGGWADATASAWPDWLEVDFAAAKTIDHVVLYTLQDNWQNPSPPDDTMTFTQYGITDFEVQGWNGSQWVTLGVVTNNNFVKRTVPFAAFTTNRVRVVVTRSLGGLSRITELEAWGN